MPAAHGCGPPIWAALRRFRLGRDRTPPDLFYIAGNTSSANGVATPGAHDVNLTGPDESLIAKYNYMSVVLPIELLAFDAEPEGAHHVRATWTTATESNNAFFTVERAADAVPTSPL
jgi:hypothetical protein